MAKAIVATLSANKTVFVVTQIYPDGTDLTKVASPATGSLLLPIQGSFWSVGDELPAEIVCNGIAAILATITTVNWTQVKAAIN